MNHFPLFFHHLKTFNQGKFQSSKMSEQTVSMATKLSKARNYSIYKNQIRSLYLVLFYAWLKRAIFMLLLVIYMQPCFEYWQFFVLFLPLNDSLHLYRLLHP